jgi:hypothetical protein
MEELIYKADARIAILKENPMVAYCIDRIKSVDAVEVVHAEWVLKQSNGYAVCNNCCRGDYVDPLAKYCRYCGALMKHEE